MDSFVSINKEFMVMLLRSIGFTGRVMSVHLAIGWLYTGKNHELYGKYVFGVGYDQFKQKWDFPGGKNDSWKDAGATKDPATQILETMYKELYEELGVTIIAPLHEFVREIIRCGAKGGNILVVCGIRSLVAKHFEVEMRRKAAIVPQLPTCYLEMTGFKYVCAKDILSCLNCTDYVKQQGMRALRIVEQSSDGMIPKFNEVMRIGK